MEDSLARISTSRCMKFVAKQEQKRRELKRRIKAGEIDMPAEITLAEKHELLRQIMGGTLC